MALYPDAKDAKRAQSSLALLKTKLQATEQRATTMETECRRLEVLDALVPHPCLPISANNRADRKSRGGATAGHWYWVLIYCG